MRKTLYYKVIPGVCLLLISLLYLFYMLQSESAGNITEYFPQTKMIKVFDGGYENSGYVQLIEILENGMIQVKELDTATTKISLYELREDKAEIQLVYSKNGVDELLRYRTTGVKHSKNIVVLKGPVKRNKKWKQNNSTYKITALNKPMITPAGTFNTIKITIKSKSGFISHAYYAKDIGLVKNELVGVSSTLQYIDYEVDKYNEEEDLWNILSQKR